MNTSVRKSYPNHVLLSRTTPSMTCTKSLVPSHYTTSNRGDLASCMSYHYPKSNAFIMYRLTIHEHCPIYSIQATQYYIPHTLIVYVVVVFAWTVTTIECKRCS